MKKILLSVLLVASVIFANAQLASPVLWSFTSKKIADKTYEVYLTATIQNSWHLYSQNVPEDGPIPTNFSFEVSKDFELVGKTSEEDGHTVDDPIFGMKIKYFDPKKTSYCTVQPRSLETSKDFIKCRLGNF